MFVNASKIVKTLEQKFPKSLAESWDNVGFQIGNIDKEVDKIMTALEINEEVIEEAIEKNVDLIVVHHPLVFKPLKAITTSSYISSLVYKMIKKDISLYVAHTNLDVANGGTNDYLAELLNLENVEHLNKTVLEKYVKLVTFVPEENLEEVRVSLGAAGAGMIGNYSECSFSTKGTGMFKPLGGSNPHIGEMGKTESVDEIKLEVIVNKKSLAQVLNALEASHPYEEVAYDIIALENEIESFGLGRVGYLSEAVDVDSFSSLIKEKLGSSMVKYVGSEDVMIKKVGLCTGAGFEYLSDAKNKNCDVYVTGDVKYHEAQYAKEIGVNVIDAGHFETENVFSKRMAEIIKAECEDKGYEVRVVESETNVNPFIIK